jgi:hypothetical protein
MQTDGQTAMTKLIAVFLQVVTKQPKILRMKVIIIIIIIIIIIRQSGNILYYFTACFTLKQICSETFDPKQEHGSTILWDITPCSQLKFN